MSDPDITTSNDVSNLWYHIGKRDAIAELLMLIHLKGEREALLEVAKQLMDSKLSPEPNPHAKWYVDAHKAKD